MRCTGGNDGPAHSCAAPGVCLVVQDLRCGAKHPCRAARGPQGCVRCPTWVQAARSQTLGCQAKTMEEDARGGSQSWPGLKRNETSDLDAECTKASLKLRQPHDVRTNDDDVLDPPVPMAQSP